MSKTKQHLHPLSLIYGFYKSIKNWGLPVVILFFGVNKELNKFGINSWELIALILLLTMTWVALTYTFFTFEIDDDMVTLNTGVLIKHHTHVPYGRIQTIQRNQWFFLRPFHLEQLKIETAGHDKRTPEIVLPVVSENVRAEIERRRTATPASASPDETSIKGTTNTAFEDSIHYQINSHDLSIFALTSFGFLPLLGILFAIYGKAQEFLPQRYLNTLTSDLVSQSILLITLTVLVIIIIAIIGSYLTLIQRYYKFELTTNHKQLKTFQGLVQRQSTTIPLNRIQAIRIKQNVLRQWAHLATIQALAASSAGDEDKNNDMMILPVIKIQNLFKQLNQFISWAPEQRPSLKPLPKRNYWYQIRNASLISLIPVAVCLYFFHFWGLFSIILLIIAVGLGWYAACNAGWQLTPDQLVLQHGSLFTRSQFIIPKKNIQSFELAQSIWMAKKQLAHLRVSIRHGNHVQVVEVRYLPLADARTIFMALQDRK